MSDIKTRAMRIVHKFFPGVTRVIDARRDLTIVVEPQDARGSGRKQHHACAMAVACKRLLHIDGAIIATSRAYLIKGTLATRYEVPESVSREIVSFDRGARFAPGTYRLAKIDASHMQGRKIKGGGKHTGTRPKPRHITEGLRATIHA